MLFPHEFNPLAKHSSPCTPTEEPLFGEKARLMLCNQNPNKRTRGDPMAVEQERETFLGLVDPRIRRPSESAKVAGWSGTSSGPLWRIPRPKGAPTTGQKPAAR